MGTFSSLSFSFLFWDDFAEENNKANPLGKGKGKWGRFFDRRQTFRESRESVFFHHFFLPTMGHKGDANVSSFPMSILVQVTTRLSLKLFPKKFTFFKHNARGQKTFSEFFPSTIILSNPLSLFSNLFSPTSAFSSSWIGIPGILLPLKMSTHSTRFPPSSTFILVRGTESGVAGRSLGSSGRKRKERG